MKIQQLPNGALIITLPIQLARAKGWKKGSEVDFFINSKGNLELKEKKE